MAKASFSLKKNFFTSKLDLIFEEETSEVLHLERSFCDAETCTLRKVEQKYMASFEMWCWRWMETISWSDRVRN